MITGGHLGKQNLSKGKISPIFSLCSLGWPGTPNVDQAGLKLTKIPLPLSPK